MNSTQAWIIGVNAGFCLVSLATASTRLHRTVIKAKSFQIHDIMLFCALVCGLTEAIIQCVATKYGLGLNVRMQPRDLIVRDFEMSSSTIETFLKLYVSFFVSYFACNMFVKLSLLAFYRKLSPDDKHLWILWIMAVTAIIFGLGSMLTALLSCVPLPKLWHPSIPGHCINLEAFYYANGSFMIFNDIILYILPILIVRRVQLSKAKAAAMNVLFALGFVVVIASVMRMIAIHNLFAAPLYSLYYQGMLLIWCTVENHLALIIVCLPAVKAALVTAAPSLSGTPSSLWSRIMGRKSSSSRLPLSNSDATRSQASSKKAKSWFSSWTSSDDTTTMTGKSRGSIGAGTELASRLPVGGRSTVVAGVHDHVHLGASDEIELRKDVYVCVSDDGGRFNDEDNDSLSSPRSFVSGKSPV